MSRHPCFRAEIWATVRALHTAGMDISAPAVRDQMQAPPAGCLERIRAYLRALVQTGHLAPLPRPEAGPGAYQLVRDTGHEAPRVRLDGTEILIGTGRERMWAVMRVLRDFTALDLAVHASVDGNVVAEREAQDFCQRISRAGFLHIVQPGRWRLNAARWRGPRPPQIRRDKHVVDPNTGSVYSPSGRQVAT